MMGARVSVEGPATKAGSGAATGSCPVAFSSCFTLCASLDMLTSARTCCRLALDVLSSAKEGIG
jgi:hypothetical protein